MKSFITLALALLIISCENDNSVDPSDNDTQNQDSIEIKVDQATFQQTFKGKWHYYRNRTVNFETGYDHFRSDSIEVMDAKKINWYGMHTHRGAEEIYELMNVNSFYEYNLPYPNIRIALQAKRKDENGNIVGDINENIYAKVTHVTDSLIIFRDTLRNDDGRIAPLEWTFKR